MNTTRQARKYRGVSIPGLFTEPSLCVFRPSLFSTSAQSYPYPPSTTNIAESDIPILTRKSLHALSLADLVKHGRPPLLTDALLSSANFTLSLLPVRLAHRIQALQNLPFIVVSNPNISKIYLNYLQSLERLIPFYRKTITSLDDEVKFISILADLVERHSRTIPTLAQGFLECRKYMKPEEVTKFLDEHLRARIGTRLIAEQHIAMHFSSQPNQTTKSFSQKVDPSSYIGVLDTALSPAFVVNCCGDFVSEICELRYGVRPSWVIDGNPSLRFAFVPVHLEYIITELLKNAFRATIESGRSHEPVIITISALRESHSDIGSNSYSGEKLTRLIKHGIWQDRDLAPGVALRIRDRGGGISPEVLPKIWSYSFTTYVDELNSRSTKDSMNALNVVLNSGRERSSIAGLGYGLPLARAYAEYFGGKLDVQSLYGWGCDVYLRLKGLY